MTHRWDRNFFCARCGIAAQEFVRTGNKIACHVGTNIIAIVPKIAERHNAKTIASVRMSETMIIDPFDYYEPTLFDPADRGADVTVMIKLPGPIK